MTPCAQVPRRPAQAGFTLVELIFVVVILGILSAIAVPKYMDMSAKAQANATKGVAAALNAAAAMAYAKSKVTPASAAPTDCQQYSGYLSKGAMPDGYTIAAGSGPTCTVNGPGTTSATFTLPNDLTSVSVASPSLVSSPSCTGEHMALRNGVCRCTEGYELNDQGTACEKDD